MKMMSKVCEIFTNTPTLGEIDLLAKNISQIEFEDKKDSSTIQASLPLSVSTKL